MAGIAPAGQVFLGQSCTSHTFKAPDIWGAEFTKIEASLVTNLSLDIPPGMYWNHQKPSRLSDLTFCNVSLEYTHPGYDDNINVLAWLPVNENWNGRLQGSGGGSFITGNVPAAMAGAVQDGYAVVSTDGGHPLVLAADLPWALSSPGNINWALLQDFASIALNDSAAIGKAVTKDFYGQAPKYSYWNGCSTGGRQGLMLAQRYPTAYDGILASAPAVGWAKFLVAMMWPQVMMYETGECPHPCELDAITAAAVEACDELDGAKDGILSSPELCTFDARTMVGRMVGCAETGHDIEVSDIAAKVANVVWEGTRRPDGSFLWYGLTHQVQLTGNLGVANTKCDQRGCQPAPFDVPGAWLRYFLKKDPGFDIKTLKVTDLPELLHQSDQQFRSIISTDDPDLSQFRDSGGKMLTWHGMADQALSLNGTRAYYESVSQFDSNVRDYYRFFEAPGAQHCWEDAGPMPGRIMEALVEWVEEGKAPDTVLATKLANDHGPAIERNLCAYPKHLKYRGSGDVTKASSFYCE